MSKDKEKVEEEVEKKVTLEDLVSEMVEKATVKVRSEYEKKIEDMEERAKKVIAECEDKVRAIISQMHNYSCYNCNKDMISGKDAIYTNYDGKKFCSHKCIDENLEKK